MAEKIKENQGASIPNTGLQPLGGGEPKAKKRGILFGILAFLVAILVITAVVGGAFFMIIKNNVNGLADKYRKEIQAIPLLNLALPEVPDPEDPKYLTDDQLKAKYQELRKKRDELTKELDEAKKKVTELSNVKTESDQVKTESEQIKKEAEGQKKQMEEEKKKIEEEKKKVNEMIATGDKAGFKEYFEKVDKETAAKIYEDIMREQKASEDAVKFSKLYEQMDASAAAGIFEEMGKKKIDLIVDILKNMKREMSAQILAAMDPTFASQVTERLSRIYLIATPVPTPMPKPS